MKRALAGFLALACLTAGCVQAGRTVHPHSDPVEGAACPVTPDPSVRTTVRIGWQGIVNGDLVVKDLNLLERCLPNASISWVRTKGGDDTIQAFGSHTIDLGIYGSSATVKSISPDLSLPLRIVWIGDVIGKAEALVARTPEIKSVKDLKGKNVAVVFGATPHYELLSMLKAEGLSGQVNLINASNDTMLAAWTKGEVDAVWTWDPTMTELQQHGGHIVMTSADAAARGYETYDLIAARREFIDANPAFMTMWTRVQDHAVGVIQDDPDAAAASIATQMGIGVEDARAQLAGYRYLRASEQAGPDYFGRELPGKVLRTARTLSEVGMIPAAGTAQHYEASVYPDAIQEVGA